MIVIIDYGMGNLRSIEKALRKINADFIISNKIEDIESATHLILPGVGFFEEGMKNLEKLKLLEVIKSQVINKKKPILGICLGMQLLFKDSEEGNVNGIGLIDGHVKKFKFETSELKIPHVGWNEVFGGDFSKIKIFKGIEEHSNFYFVHSYYAILNEKVQCSFTDYGSNFISAIQKENIYGTQFHPEKSQRKGLEILKNFVSIKC